MPLQDYISETVHILSAMPNLTEVIVERVKQQRYSEARGEYDAFFKRFNDLQSGRSRTAVHA
jgi:short-subunit dehydrogenase involved in D-alanine esterification of teichoic acids